MKNALEKRIEELWKTALASWYHPAIPDATVAKNAEEIATLDPLTGGALTNNLAFMELRDFRTYANLEKITKVFHEDPERGLKAVFKHEQGHRFCPYDVITMMIMFNSVKKGLEDMSMTPYKKSSLNSSAQLVLNLFADMTVNTTLARKNDKDIVWAYQQIIKGEENSKFWRVYGRSMELAWSKKLLPDAVVLDQDESDAAQSLADLFKEDVLDKRSWKNKSREYARTISKFLEGEQKQGKPCFDDITSNMPQKPGKELLGDIAKRFAKPNDASGFDEFKDLTAGVGKGDAKYASKAFYEALARAYDVEFTPKPEARTKQSPFQPEKWQPSMGADRLDIDYSTQIAGKLIPGVTTYTWKHRKRERKNGLEDVIPDVDIYLDGSGSTQNPLEKLSLFALTVFVVARKAHKKGAKIRITIFSGDGQYDTQEWTRDLNAIYEKAIIYYGSGTSFPTHQLLRDTKQKHVIIITDAALDNKEQAAAAVSEVLKRSKSNKVTVYAITIADSADYLKKVGADIIQGTTTDIFRKVIGKSGNYVK